MAHYLDAAVAEQRAHAAQYDHLVDELLASGGADVAARRDAIEGLDAFCRGLCVHGRTAINKFNRSRTAFVELQALVRTELAAAGSHARLRSALRARWPCSCRKVYCRGRRPADEINAELDGPLAELIAERDYCPLLELPNELLAQITIYLSPRERSRLRTLCRRLRAVVDGSAVDWLRATGVLRLPLHNLHEGAHLATTAFAGGLYVAWYEHVTGEEIYINSCTRPAVYYSINDFEYSVSTRVRSSTFHPSMIDELLKAARTQPALFTTAVSRMRTRVYEKRQLITIFAEHALRTNVVLPDITTIGLRMSTVRVRGAADMDVFLAHLNQRLPYTHSIVDMRRMLEANAAEVDLALCPPGISNAPDNGWVATVRKKMIEDIATGAQQVTVESTVAQIGARVRALHDSLRDLRVSHRAEYLQLIRSVSIWYLGTGNLNDNLRKYETIVLDIRAGRPVIDHRPGPRAPIREVARSLLTVFARHSATEAWRALDAALAAVGGSVLLAQLADGFTVPTGVLTSQPKDIVLEDALWLLRSIAPDDEFDVLAAHVLRKRRREDDAHTERNVRPRIDT